MPGSESHRVTVKAIFREHLSLLLRKGCEYVIGNRRVTPNAVYAVANAIYLRTIKGVAHVSHRQLAEDALTSKRTVTAAIGVLQMIGLIRVVSSHSGGLLLGGAPRVKRARFVVKDWGGRAVSSVADKYPGNEKSG